MHLMHYMQEHPLSWGSVLACNAVGLFTFQHWRLQVSYRLCKTCLKREIMIECL